MLADGELRREPCGYCGGMGSDYRSFLVSISECAERYLVAEMLRPDSMIDDLRASEKRRLADELAFAAAISKLCNAPRCSEYLDHSG
jgi:hypothetical protein